jgi:hypothetical protein
MTVTMCQERAPLIGLSWSGSQCNLVSDRSIRVYILRWHNIGWSPIKSMMHAYHQEGVSDNGISASFLVEGISVLTIDSGCIVAKLD